MSIRAGDLAVDRAVRIIEHEVHLLGLDRPGRTELSGPDGLPVRSSSTDELE
ncbi:hypothetical protein [Streptomyces roseoverticillatus]|uniref:Uncharacterized protein n=1 Tax=Streptomyces roseoverticillatus TaxID=66429 RepID=A0ABV3J120_9ACTN